MRFTLITPILLTLASAACAQTAPAAAAAAPDASIQKTLKLLELRGASLKDFTATLRYSVEHVREGTVEANGGTAAFVRDDPAKTRVAILLDTLIVDGAIAREGLNHQVVFDGQWLTEKDPPNKIYRRIEVARAGKTTDPFALRGPLPLPIGQKVERVLEEFTVEKIPFVDNPKKPIAKEPVALRLTPKKEKIYDFKQLEVIVDTAAGVELPVRINKTGLDENVTTVIFRDLKINTGETAKLPIFDVSSPPKDQGWVIDVKTLDDPATAPAPATKPRTP